ncbi:MAG: SH3 domain-containing protein [Burkholderiales bacterium]|nr:SH3 domain-containing protein [Anaerolineae bacterium]
MRRVRLISVLLLFLFPSLALAQGDCPVIVETALAAANTFCGGAGRNEACYGNVLLTAQPQPGVSDFQFEAPGDLESLTDIQTMQLSSQIAEEGVWGIALLRVQANLPDTLPGQNVTLLLFGDAQIEDASNEAEVASRMAGELPADPEATAEAGTPPTAMPMPTIAVTANGGANVRAGASTEAGVVAGLTAGQTATAVGRNEASDWLQIRLDDGTMGWVATRIVTADGDVAILPVTQSSGNSAGSSGTSAEAAGGEIRFGQVITGSINNAAPEQNFTFAAESGDVVTITLEGGGSGLDPFLELLGPGGQTIAVNDDSGSLDSAIQGMTLGESGNYTIVATRYEGGSSTGAYELALTLDSAASYGPMQAFYFRTGIGDAPCAEAPDSGILVQAPGGAGVVNLRVNEVEIQLASSVYLQAQPNNDMIISVIEGHARATAFGVSVVAPAGTRIRVPMNGRPAASGPPVGPESYGDLGPLPVDNLAEPIEIAEPLPESELVNIGVVEMTLTWSANADLDLHVYEPNGDEIWFGRTVTSSGGELSSDENIECVGTGSYTETVQWPRGGALFGDYRVSVDVFDDCGVGNPSWSLVVNVDGEAVVSEEGSGNAEFPFTR